jgi:hypothetical protein
MRLEITRAEGLRNDLLLRVERPEVEHALLSVANRGQLLALPGMPRHRAATVDEAERMAAAKVPLEEHLRRMELVDASGRACRRAIAISNRNLGTNHGHVAWQRDQTPAVFHVLEDPLDYDAYSCLTVWRDRRLTFEHLKFDVRNQRVLNADDDRDLSDDIEWATFGQMVLRAGQVVPVDAIAHQFYDIRHLLAFDSHRPEGESIRQDIYRGYPKAFREAVAAARREKGVPRARYFHNALGLSRDALFVLQREGTVEEIAETLKTAGAYDGVILDNGGSVACWVWWANQYAGGIISPTVDYRPPGTSAIGFALSGPLEIKLPGGSVSYSVC